MKTVLTKTFKGASFKYMKYNIMDTNNEIISKLKFISKLKKGEKINTKHMFVQPTGFSTFVSRTFFNQDNRGNALSFCQETITRSFELLVTYERSDKQDEKVMFNHLLYDLEMSMNGLQHLKITYITDTKFCCDMDTLLQIMAAKLSKYDQSDDQSCDREKLVEVVL